MLQFKGKRKLEEIQKRVLESGGQWDQAGFDAGSDIVYFRFNKKNVCYNTFNGRFSLIVSKRLVTELSTHMENRKWYRDLLNLLYTPKEVRKHGNNLRGRN